MADQVKEFAMKVFTDSELIAGTRFDMTVGSSEAAVIKDIELTQGSDTQAVSGTVTAGTTANFGNGIHSQLGTFGSGVTNLTGSAILDASSTLSVRPNATAIAFSDVKIYAEDGNATTSAINPINLFTTPKVNGLSEATTQTVLTPSNPGNSAGSYNGYAGEFVINHTTANGIELYMRFARGASSGYYVYITGADNNTNYAQLSTNYSRICWDGKRYLFWMYDGYVYFFDLDDSNITNPNTHGTTCHGRMTVGNSVNSVWTSSNPSSYQQTAGDLKVSPVDGKTYFYQFLNSWGMFVQLPDTIADNVVVPKFWLTGNGNSYGTINPSGLGHANNVYMNEYYLFSNFNGGTNYSWSQIFIKEDATNGDRWFIAHKKTGDEVMFFTWLDADMKNLANGGTLGTNDSSGGNHPNYGLSSISYQDLGKAALGWATSNFENYSKGAVLKWDSTYAGSNLPSSFQTGSNNHYFFDGETFYIANFSSNDKGIYKLPLNSSSGELVVSGTDHVAYRGNYFIGFPTPTSTETSSRTYTKKPALKVRITGIREDRS